MANSLIDQFGTETNPVGWSSTTPAQVMTGPRPFRESSESWLPGATRPLFQDELEKARQSSLSLFEQLGMIPSGGAGGKAAKMLASRRVSNLPTPPIRVYHGSGADFKKFSSDFIGTGEGGQRFGRGGYFAESEALGKRYRDKVAENRIPPDEILKKFFTPGEIVPSYGGGRDKVISFEPKTHGWFPTVIVQEVDNNGKIIGRLRSHGTMPDVKEINQVFAQRNLPMYTPGHMYEVDLHTSPNRLLDLDLPLLRQPKEILDALPLFSKFTRIGKDLFPNEFVRPLQKQEQTEKLQSIGIDGARYFDAASRKAQEGTRNYAIWNDDIIEILRKYGIGGLGVGLSANPLLEQRGSAPQQGAPQ